MVRRRRSKRGYGSMSYPDSFADRYGFPIFFGFLISVVVFVIGYNIWFELTHHCVKTDTHWVAEYTSTDTTCMSMSDGNQMCTDNTTVHEAHWETTCVAWEKN